MRSHIIRVMTDMTPVTSVIREAVTDDDRMTRNSSALMTDISAVMTGISALNWNKSAMRGDIVALRIVSSPVMSFVIGLLWLTRKALWGVKREI